MNEGKQKKGLKRNRMNKFYTKDEIIKYCFNILLGKLFINKNDFIIEPNMGNCIEKRSNHFNL